MLELVIILAVSIPVTCAIVGFVVYKQTDLFTASLNSQMYEFFVYMEKNQQVGGKPVELFKEELNDQREERKIRLETIRPPKTPSDLLR